MGEVRDFLFPDLGEGLTEGELLEWLVAVGDTVSVDQPVAEVSTEKAAVQVPVPFAGVVVTLHGEPGGMIEVGAPLISIEVATPAPATSATPATPVAPAMPGAPGTAGPEPTASGNVLVGYGTAAEGSRRRARVRAPALGAARTAPARRHQPTAGAPTGERIPLTGVRRITAERLGRSHREAPDATAWVSADATGLLAQRDLLNERQHAVHVTPLAVLLRLCAQALLRFPALNSHVDAATGDTVLARSVHLGVAVQAPQGLLVPVVRDAQDRSTVSIAAELARLAGRARDGSIAADEMTGGTFTVSNFGAFGVDGGAAILNPPEAGILGVGRIAERPWVVAGTVVPRPTLVLSLVFDHRACDGGTAGGFLRLLADLVEQPEVEPTDE